MNHSNPKPVIAIHGLQGSGKTYLVNTITSMIIPNGTVAKPINIKGTFQPIAKMVTDYYKSIGYELNEGQMKQLLLSISTYGEKHVDEMIWTKTWVNSVSMNPDVYVLTDDIRTQFNIRGLRQLAEIRKVVLFSLDVPEDIRRRRLGNKWRDNGGYTEVLMDRPSDLPENFHWVNLNEDWTITEVKKHIFGEPDFR